MGPFQTAIPKAGGALVNTTEGENFPGFTTGILGPDLMENMRAQAERFGARLIYDDATRLDLAGDMKVVVARDRSKYRTRAVVLAMGSAYRKLGVPGEDRLTGHGVSWCATCDGFFFRNQNVVVVGGVRCVKDVRQPVGFFLVSGPASLTRRGGRKFVPRLTVGSGSGACGGG